MALEVQQNMGQETDLWENEASTVSDRTEERKPTESGTGRDMPSGDGDVGDEQVTALDGGEGDTPIGQDHSMDVENRKMPNIGVGAIQDGSQPTRSRADIDE